MSGDVTEQALARLSRLPDSTNPAELIAGQHWDDVLFVGGDISGVNIHSLSAPIAISDGGTGETTANSALNALLPTQTGNSGKVLKTDGTNTSWASDADTGITQLTGDVTAGPGNGSQVATLATVNSNVGSFGSSTSIPSFTVNGKGIITAASGNAVIAPAGTLTGNTLASNIVTSSLTSVGTLAAVTVTGEVTAGNVNVTSSTAPTNGMFLITTNTLAWSINGTNEMRLTSSALSPSTSDGNALGTSVLMWADLFLASGGVINFNNGNVTLTHAAGSLTLGGSGAATLALGTNSITMTGSIAATGSRVTKVWTTDIESTNAPTVGGNAATGTGGLVLATSPTLVTPALGVATATSLQINGGTVIGNFVEGSSTPTINNITNVSATGWTLFYYRIGNSVNFWGGGTIDPVAASLIEFTLTLPIASNFSVEANAGGLCCATNVNTSSFAVYADPTTDTLFIRGVATTTSAFSAVISGSYRVI